MKRLLIALCLSSVLHASELLTLEQPEVHYPAYMSMRKRVAEGKEDEVMVTQELVTETRATFMVLLAHYYEELAHTRQNKPDSLELSCCKNALYLCCKKFSALHEVITPLSDKITMQIIKLGKNPDITTYEDIKQLASAFYDTIEQSEYIRDKAKAIKAMRDQLGEKLYKELKNPDSSEKTIEELLSRHDLTRYQYDEWFPLHYAIKQGRVRLVKLLLNHGAPQDDAIQGRLTPLLIASMQGHEEISILLLQKSADTINCALQSGSTALHLWARHGSLSVVNLLIARGASLTATDERGYTPLHYAVNASANAVEVVKALCEKGAQPNAPDNKGLTPLCHAVCNENVDVVSALLSYENSIDHLESNSAFHRACKQTNPSLCRPFLGSPGGLTLDAYTEQQLHDLHKAFFFSTELYAEFLDQLACKLADVDQQDDQKNTPLLYAARQGKLGHCELLLQHHASATSRNLHGETPLLCVLRSSTTTELVPLVQLLLEHEADPHAADIFGITPYAITDVLKLEAVHTLWNDSEEDTSTPVLKTNVTLKSQALPTRNRQHNMLLHSAIEMNLSLERCRELIDSQKVIIDMQNEQGKTALHMAAERDMTDHCLLFLEAGASPFILDTERRSPLHIAAQLPTNETFCAMIIGSLEHIGQALELADTETRDTLLAQCRNYFSENNPAPAHVDHKLSMQQFLEEQIEAATPEFIQLLREYLAQVDPQEATIQEDAITEHTLQPVTLSTPQIVDLVAHGIVYGAACGIALLWIKQAAQQ